MGAGPHAELAIAEAAGRTKRYYARKIKKRDEPYHLTDKGRAFFKQYYSHRDGR